MSHLKSFNAECCFGLRLFGQAPLCFTRDEWGCYMVFASSLPLILKQNSTSSVGSQPNQTGMKPGLLRRLNHLLCSVAQLKALVGVCILFCCCSVCLAYLTAELPLIVLYLSLPLRKLLQSLGCCATVSVCVCVCLWMQGYGNSKFMFFVTSSPGFLDLLFAAESRVLSQSRSVDDVRQC